MEKIESEAESAQTLLIQPKHNYTGVVRDNDLRRYEMPSWEI